MYLPAPRWLYRWQLKRELLALSANTTVQTLPNAAQYYRRHIWQTLWVDLLAGAGLCAIFLASLVNDFWNSALTLVGITSLLLTAYVQLLLFIWSNEADKALRSNNFGRVHALRLNRSAELITLE